MGKKSRKYLFIGILLILTPLIVSNAYSGGLTGLTSSVSLVQVMISESQTTSLTSFKGEWPEEKMGAKPDAGTLKIIHQIFNKKSDKPKPGDVSSFKTLSQGLSDISSKSEKEQEQWIEKNGLGLKKIILSLSQTQGEPGNVRGFAAGSPQEKDLGHMDPALAKGKRKHVKNVFNEKPDVDKSQILVVRSEESASGKTNIRGFAAGVQEVDDKSLYENLSEAGKKSMFNVILD